MNYKKSLGRVLALALVTLTSFNAHATTYNGSGDFGAYIGTYYGPDTIEWFDNVFGLEVTLAGNILSPDMSDDYFSIADPIFNDNGGVVSGQWTYNGPDVITYLVFGAGPMFSLYEFSDGLNTGYFNTAVLLNKPIDFIRVYSIDAEPVPLPAAVWLLLSGCIALAGLGRRQR